MPRNKTPDRAALSVPARQRPRVHVVLLDGTMSSLVPGFETNIGLTFRLLTQYGRRDDLSIFYEPGIQWRGIGRMHEVIAGIGINRQILRAYLFLAKHYRIGDQIVLMGFSRGAYAVRSLAGLIDQMGLLRPGRVNEDRLGRIYEHYRTDPTSQAAQDLRARHCRQEVEIAFLGVYDTVRALGIRWPLLWRFLGEVHPYHNHDLGESTRIGRHALALDETREAYLPVLWNVPEDRLCETAGAQGCDIVQMWFRGTHGDIGGQLGGRDRSRPLSNITLVWMLGEAEAAGLGLPNAWRQRFPTDPEAPSIGKFAGWSKIFLDRQRRVVGIDPSEAIHPSAGKNAEGPARDLPPAALER
ncbi:MAG: DUF2235 domain-containing protein [Pseudomonadota bacterium]